MSTLPTAQNPSPQLLKLAQAHGVSTEYWDYQGKQTSPSAEALVAVLEAMGVAASDDAQIEASLREVDIATWRDTLPPTVVVRAGAQSSISVHVPDGAPVTVRVHLEDDTWQDLAQVEDWTPPRLVAGVNTGQATFLLPLDLPLGWHTLVAEVGASWAGDAYTDTAPLVVAPEQLPLPPTVHEHTWGAMAQLYSVRSAASWGVGDADDLAELLSFLGDQGADFLLVNPLHAAQPVPPLTPSPYLPTSRRFINPLYIRPENILEVSRLSGSQRSLVQWAFEEVKPLNFSAQPIDRDASWKAKMEALEVIFAAGRSRARQRDFERFRAQGGAGLERFALWCALREKYGKSAQWPPQLRDSSSPYVANEAHALSARLDFFAWLQWIVDQQLTYAQQTAKASGMALGLMEDLAVGVHARGADVWACPQAFATGIEVGAPPDMYNQLGQNWSQPPWNPKYLARHAYQPWRDLVRSALRHAGALRIDHIIGLFRLWWIPAGMTPAQGTYVRYDHEAMLGILMLEAYRAGAVIVGEDLGTVEPWVRDYLASRGILGTAVLWFEKQADGWPKLPDAYRHLCMASVTTHDLPPTAGYLADVHVDLREALGLLTQPVAQVRAQSRLERERMFARLREQNLLPEQASEREIVEALYRYVARTPAALVAVALVDAVGDRRIQNQPGTDQEYPNWKLPLTDANTDVVLVEDLPKNVRLESLFAAVRQEFAR